ncbi:MAG: hypothetical protein Q9219_006133 [cf. Caloplaca sp. 3 TL-2023]
MTSISIKVHEQDVNHTGQDKIEKYGQRLLPSVLDQWASNEPTRLYAMVPPSEHSTEGMFGVTMLQMAHSVNITARWLNATFRASTTPGTLAYIGASDLRYPIVHLATMKLGWKLVLLGTRNTVHQNHSILSRTNCTNVLHTTEMESGVVELQSQRQDLFCNTFISLSEILAIGPHDLPYEKKFQEARDDVALMIHSSGSTGEPKIVQMTHGTFSATDLDRTVPVPSGRRAQNAALFDFPGGGKAYSCFPPYHLAGIQAFTILPIFYGVTAVFGPSSVPATGNHIMEIMHQVKLNAIYVPPAILEAWVRLPDALEQAAKLDFVLYGGGPLSTAAGKLLDEVCNLCQVYGSAEIGQVQLLVPLKGNWAHLELNPYDRIDMQYSEQHKAYEMVLHQDPRVNHWRSLYYNYPEKAIWRTQDLFLPVRGISGLWDFYGRIDDLILLSNGHKINPLAMETRIMGHALLSGALITGTGRSCPAIVLEIRSDARGRNKQELIDSIWPLIEEANKSVPGYAQILRSMVLFASAEKPFVRAPKSSIVRKMTLENYAEDLEKLYASRITLEHQPCWVVEDLVLATIRQFVQTHVQSMLPRTDLEMQANLFLHGLDSLKALELGNLLFDGFHAAGELDHQRLATETIYRNPSIEGLVQATFALLVQKSNAIPSLPASSPQTLVARYTDDLEDRNNTQGRINVLMTGSTGFLGRHLLRTLVQNPRIEKVYCLNRFSVDAENGTKPRCPANSADQPEYSKIQDFRIDLSEKQFGLADKIWLRLRASTHIIIHLAWEVNFAHPLVHFESTHIRGLRTLIDLSRDGRHRPRIAFASSTGTMSNWQRVHGSDNAVPETLSEDPSMAPKTGYSQSKQVAERILQIASTRCGIPVSIMRIGQIAGSVDGEPGLTTSHGWPSSDMVALLMQRSKRMGLLPSFNAHCDWIPVDTVAQILHEILFPTDSEPSEFVRNNDEYAQSKPKGARVYNLVHPRPIRWDTLIKTIQTYLGNHRDVKIVPLRDWVEALRRMDEEESNPRGAVSRPELGILSSFLEEFVGEDGEGGRQGCLSFETKNGVEASRTMAGLQPVDAEWIKRWVEQWRI